jgi:hypothetical protein
MLAFADVVDAHVKLCAAGHLAGNLFAREKILVMAQALRTIEGVVIA